MSVDEAFKRILGRGEEGPAASAAPRAERAQSHQESGLNLRKIRHVEELGYPPIEEHTGIEAEYRRLRLRLQSIHLRRRSVLFTSCRRGEGKTPTAVYTALAMARRREERVVLIDLNLRRPGVAELMGIDAACGVREVVRGECSLEEALLHVDEDDLYVLPAGEAIEDPAEVLESGALRSLMVEMHQEFDFLLVDAAPCLSTVDPFLFGHLCGGAVLTVRAHETLRSDVADALRVLEENEVQPLGMVLTFAREFVPHLLRSR